MGVCYNAPVILTFALISFGLFLADACLGTRLIADWCVSPGQIQSLSDYPKLFTYIAGHADSSHLVGNFLVILLIGPLLEERFGSLSLLFMIAVTAATTSVAHLLFFDGRLVGASGIVFMFMILASCTNRQNGKIPLTFLLVSTLLFSKEVVGSLKADSISQFGHIMGGLMGVFFGLSTKNLLK